LDGKRKPERWGAFFLEHGIILHFNTTEIETKMRNTKTNLTYKENPNAYLFC
jgi:hypothetical protein